MAESANPEARRLKVFISYATEDRDTAREIVERLISEGFNPWYDQDLLPGQHWENEIESNQKDADVVIILLSRKSVDKRGFVQREAAAAVRKLDDQLPGDIYIIPVRLDDCAPPERIAGKIQYIDWTRDDAWRRITTSLRSAARSRNLSVGNEKAAGQFRVLTQELRDQSEGPHPYDHTIEYPEFYSATLPKEAAELSEYFAAAAKNELVLIRRIRWRTQFGFDGAEGESSFLQSSVGPIYANSRLVSLLIETHSYSIGAAHGNMHFESHNFILDAGRVIPFTVAEILDRDNDALTLISSLTIEKLKAELWNKTGEECDDSIDIEWFTNGAGPEWDNFKNFTLNRDGITFYFPPYQVHAYVYGDWSVHLSFFELRSLQSVKFLMEIATADT